MGVWISPNKPIRRMTGERKAGVLRALNPVDDANDDVVSLPLLAKRQFKNDACRMRDQVLLKRRYSGHSPSVEPLPNELSICARAAGCAINELNIRASWTELNLDKTRSHASPRGRCQGSHWLIQPYTRRWDYRLPACSRSVRWPLSPRHDPNCWNPGKPADSWLLLSVVAEPCPVQPCGKSERTRSSDFALANSVLTEPLAAEAMAPGPTVKAINPVSPAAKRPSFRLPIEFRDIGSNVPSNLQMSRHLPPSRANSSKRLIALFTVRMRRILARLSGALYPPEKTSIMPSTRFPTLSPRSKKNPEIKIRVAPTATAQKPTPKEYVSWPAASEMFDWLS
jgi:hypothetical protein